jgi:RNA polymerase sigma factor (sigma-70 family)
MASNLSALHAAYTDGHANLDDLLLAVRSYALAVARRSRNPHPEDAAQEITLKVWRSLPTFTGAASFKTFCHCIAKTHLLNSARDAGRRAQLVQQDNLEDEARETSNDGPMRDYNSLPERFRFIATMFAAGYSQDHVAYHLGCSVRSLRRYITRHCQLQNASVYADVPKLAAIGV